MIYRIVMPGDDKGATVRQFVADWLGHPALRRIVEAEGGMWPDGNLEDRAEALHRFSAKWDRRSGGERLTMSAGEVAMDVDDLLADAAELGMTESRTPTQHVYEHGLTLGGTALASIYRVMHLFGLRAGGVGLTSVGILTALREIAAEERRLVSQRADIAELADYRTEFDVMVAAAERFAIGTAEVHRTDHENPHLRAADAQVDGARVLAAPSGDASRRPNTFDNYAVYRRNVDAGDRLLIVTSSVYLPYQFFVALQALGWKRPLTVEAVGFPPEWMQGVLTGPANVLQELRSGLYAARRTLAALGTES